MTTIACKVSARELALYTVNDSKLYRHATACLENLAKKVCKGVYNSDKALILWGHHATIAAKQYTREFDSIGSKYHQTFNAATRRLAAVEIAAHYREELLDLAS